MRWTVAALVLGLGACGADPEGANPGECTDLTDNDRDGLIDALDPDCTGGGTAEAEGLFAGDCSDGIDNDGDGPADCDDADCTGAPECEDWVHSGLRTVLVTMELEIKLRALGAPEDGENAFCSVDPGLCDCVNTYAGDGVLSSAGGVRAAFQGSWDLASSTCGASLRGAIWYAENAGTAYHTIRWTEDGATVVEWIVHEDPNNDEPIPADDGPKEQEQFSVYGLTEPFVGNAFSHADTGFYDDALFRIYTTTTLNVSFE